MPSSTGRRCCITQQERRIEPQRHRGTEKTRKEMYLFFSCLLCVSVVNYFGGLSMPYPVLQSRADILRMLDELTAARTNILTTCATLTPSQLADAVIPGTWSLVQ